MKTKDAMKVIDDGWVRRLKGFRVHFQKMTESGWITDYFPGEEYKPLTSEISVWELARRFAEATKSDGSEFREGDCVNIFVVDDEGNQIKFYGTGQIKVLNANVDS